MVTITGKNMIMGGASLASAFLEHGLVDEVYLYIPPILLGGGKPMFPSGKEQNFQGLNTGQKMLTYNHTFSSFSVDKLLKAKKFYRETLGLDIEETGEMGLSVRLKDNHRVFIYPKVDHQPATFTVLNFVVDEIDTEMESLKQRGVKFIHYQNKHLPQDEQGVLRGLQEKMGPDIAWFKDPAGNVLAIVQEK